MKRFRKIAYRYAFSGVLLGLLFPVIGTVLQSTKNYGNADFTSLLSSQLSSPLLWIIDSAPLILGLFAYWVGRQTETTQKQYQEIWRAHQQLFQQERMATIGQMTAGIAHEMKNPLNLITNFSESSAQLAEEVKDLVSRYRQHFESEDFTLLLEMIGDLRQNALDVFGNGHRANDIIHALMDHARGNRGIKMLTDINTLVKTNLNLAYQGYRASHPVFNLSIDCDFDEDLPRLFVNPPGLGRVILNILNNACYAIDRKQTDMGADFKPGLQIRTRKMAQYILICIRDNGDGIPPEIRDSIFEPFFTTKPVGEANTGLGLSISKDIVEEHLGTLEMTTEAGLFTEFVIKLPRLLAGENPAERN